MSGSTFSLLAEVWRRLGDPSLLSEIFDRLPDVIIALKDHESRYLWVSQAIVERCGLRNREQAIGQRAIDIFPVPMAERYEAQDRRVFRTGRSVHDALDLTVFADGVQGWCLTQKMPVFDDQGAVIAVFGLSRDLVEPSRAGLFDARFVEALDYLQANLAEPLRVEALATRAGLTPAQFERRMKRLFQLSPAQYLLKLRIDAAAEFVLEDRPLREVAQAVGFCDQAALTRTFKKATGMTPGAYRKARSNGEGRAEAVDDPSDAVRGDFDDADDDSDD